MADQINDTPLSRGLDGRLYRPLHTLFGALGISAHKGWGEQSTVLTPPINLRYAHLRAAMERHGPLSFASHEKRIPSSWDLYYHAAAVPMYYPPIAEKKIGRDNLGFLIELFTGSTFVELGAGDGRKTIELFEETAHPQRVCGADILMKNVNAFVRAFRKMDCEAIGMHVDMMQDYFWRDLSDVLRGIREPKTVILLQGATYNNFERDEMVALLANSHYLPDNTTLLYYIDNTTDYRSLKDAYATVEMQHLLLSAAEPQFHMHRKLPDTKLTGTLWDWSGLDYLESGIKDATANISIGPYGPFQAIFFSVSSGDGNYSVNYVPIQKIPAEIKTKATGEEIGGEMGRMIREAQVEVVRRMPFRSPDFPAVEYSLYAFRPHRPVLMAV